MNSPNEGLARSVLDRLVAHARRVGADPNLVLARYGIERLLYRLGRSSHVERFVLKGGLMLLVWLGEQIRPTRDADLLGYGDVGDEELGRIFRELCTLAVELDGVVFDAASVRVDPIRAVDEYGGRRVTMTGELGSARLRVQVDVGVGDAVSPPPEWIDYPSLLDVPVPRLRAYRPETSIAEKLHAMVALAEIDSRMRDFFDLWVLAERLAFDGESLATAVRATFARRGMSLPAEVPIALTAEFAALPGKREMWASFVRKNHLESAPDELAHTIERIAAFLMPVVDAARGTAAWPAAWSTGGPWREIGESAR